MIPLLIGMGVGGQSSGFEVDSLNQWAYDPGILTSDIQVIIYLVVYWYEAAGNDELLCVEITHDINFHHGHRVTDMTIPSNIYYDFWIKENGVKIWESGIIGGTNEEDTLDLECIIHAEPHWEVQIELETLMVKEKRWGIWWGPVNLVNHLSSVVVDIHKWF